ncbi:MAG: TlpA family protein disulfide reductase [Bryobacterales bacterium]|nr:TlpA family protein disulfide reductase [Bryobacterales bacterium]
MKHLPILAALFFLTLPIWPQDAPAAPDSTSATSDSSPAKDESGDAVDLEEEALRAGVRDANGSQIDIIRALEKHLARFPESKRREEIQYVLLKSAIDLGDDTRVARYGVLFLDTGANDVAVMDRVIPLLLRDPSEAMSKRVLAYAKRYETAAQAIAENRPEATGLLPSWKQKRDRAFARAFVFQARAEGNLGHFDEALKLARRSYDIDPSSESAREMGRWQAKLGQNGEALASYADAFAIEDPRNDAAHRDQDLIRLREIYVAKNGAETGLGDLILAAHDRTRTALATKRAELDALAPNAASTKPAEFVLAALEGEPLSLASLRGKVVVLDFWATWCGPCRMQHPLYEEVKQRFAKNADVRFLSVNTDEDREAVKPFILENGWPQQVYFEDGLAGILRISSIPTTLIIGRQGAVFSRMNGFVPDTFVDQLSSRVNEALNESGGAGETSGSMGDVIRPPDSEPPARAEGSAQARSVP